MAVAPAGTDAADCPLRTLAATLRHIGRPAPLRDVRILAVRASLIARGLPDPDPDIAAWGQAVRHLRGAGSLIEDLAAGTWAPGRMDGLVLDGWPTDAVRAALRDGDTISALMDAASWPREEPCY